MSESCHWCGETDQRKLKDSRTYQGEKIKRCVRSWDCHQRRFLQKRRAK